MSKNETKRKSNINQIKEQLSQGHETKLQNGVFVFHGPLKISEFASKINKPASSIITYFFTKKKLLKQLRQY